MWTFLTIKIICAYTGFNCGTQFKDLAGEKLKRQIIDVHELLNGRKPYVYRTFSRVAIISPGIGPFNYINQLSDVSLNKSNLLWFFFYPTKKYGWGKKYHMIFFTPCMIFITPSQYHNFVHMIVLIEDIALICYWIFFSVWTKASFFIVCMLQNTFCFIFN